MTTCLWKCCPHYKDPCSVYGYPGMNLRIRLGYCPVLDEYFDSTKQEAYWKEKHPAKRGRIGQQKSYKFKR